MAKLIEPPRPPRRGAAQELKSQLALELMLNVFAIGAAAVVLRCLLLSVGITDRYWIGATILGPTDLLVSRLMILPGADLTLVGRMTLIDVTLLACVVLVPIGILARPARTRSSLQ